MDVSQLRFLDSFQHMEIGLDKLVKCLEGKLEKFTLTVRKDFYSLLSQQNISKEDYEHAHQKTDVLLLADIFINYTIMCLKDDGLDPSHYVSTLEMFNDSLYKSSRAELKLMTNMDEYLMVENGICGGMTMFWILYEDMNALYSGAMIQYMPTEILGKVTPEKIPDIQSIAPNAEIGYTLEVDLEVPVHLHDFFADYPLAPKKQIVPEDWLSLYNEKLVNDKKMKDYIEKNIRKRKIAKANRDEFGVMYYKLKNNAVFGKQMENVCKHMKVELLQIEEDKKIRRLASSPLYVN
ncbi:uncharacterized protein LOC114538016 [Rhizophagus irregularis DAOM 181602=DAOM 197198]|nr:uncharacterized protein LOC114538016 [Rhizophagus irregularis DAOM 181602=DAOM 197198]